jgi:hypothetical protein
MKISSSTHNFQMENKMKKFGPLTICVLIIFGGVTAEAKIRSNERWCLETSNGAGGGTRFECTFETREQCMQSKVAHGDQCSPNTRG